MLFKDKYHITYCTNIHPGQDWEQTFYSLKDYVPTIKSAVSKDQTFGLGLRLSNKASEELNQGDRLAKFKTWLEEQGLYVFTMNGFPYGNFHNERVKENVYLPDWTSRSRVDYTKRLFEQLALLIPKEMEGGISTAPIGYKHRFSDDISRREAFKKSAEHICEVVIQLYELEKTTGTYLHLDIEPEPDCLIENSKELVSFFQSYLLPSAQEILKNKLGLSTSQIPEIVLKYVTVCYDICHFSLAYESPGETFKRLEEFGIKIGKIQVSAALKILFERHEAKKIWDTLERFDEPTYLHQVTERDGGQVKTYPDLPDVLGRKASFSELRAHFHVPIFLEEFDALYSTQDQILEVISYLKRVPITKHLEVETYTWEVLPSSLKLDLSESIIRELTWLTEKL